MSEAIPVITPLNPAAAEYPRTYRLPLISRIFLIGLGVALLACTLGGAAVVAATVQLGPGGVGIIMAKIMLIMVMIMFLCVGVFMAIAGLRAKLILHADAFESQGVLRRRRLRRDQIAGRRVYEVRGDRILLLVPREARNRVIQVRPEYQTDAVFEAWLAALPDPPPAVQAHGSRCWRWSA